jgi:dienelactone hydrolase
MEARMAQEIVLFHSALGLRPAVLEFAERLRVAGHMVYTPDLFDGQTFDTLEKGSKKRDALGIPELMRRAGEALAHLPVDLIYAGFSMGAAPAEYFAATRAGARGAVLMHGALGPEKAQINSWPRGVPVQIHYAKNDSQVDAGDVNSLAAAVREAGGKVECYSYANGGHLFADDGSADYNRASAWLMEERINEFISRIDLSDVPTVEMPVTEREVAHSRAHHAPD